MFEEIISWENVSEAYLNLYEKFTEKSKGRRYHAFDGRTLYDTEVSLDEILKEAIDELASYQPLQVAQYHEIPKKTGGIRPLTSLSIKERIKCQALYRVLEPYFEKRYSKYIHSFRSSHPSYYASRSVRRFYLKHFGNEMYVLRMDIHKYADYINHNYLIDVLKKHEIEPEVIELIKLYLHQPFIKDGTVHSRSTGIMQGMNLCPLFYNIYIGHIDDYLGKKVQFYRRVGDDLILFDPNKENLLNAKKYIETEAEKAKIYFNPTKQNFGNINEEHFTFHGLLYNDGKVSFPEKSFQKIITDWQKKLKYIKNSSFNSKMSRLKRFLMLKHGSKGQLLMHYIRAYNLITDTKQIQEMSKRLFHILTRYFTGRTTYRDMKRTKKILKDFQFPTLTKLHYLYSNGKIKRVKNKY